MKTLICIDQGPTHSGVVELREREIKFAEVMPNELVRPYIEHSSAGMVVCEQIECFGMPVGREVFESVQWMGRFEELALGSGKDFASVPRRQVKMHLCNSVRAKDPHIRQVLIDIYGGKQETKKGGRLASIKSHLWSALAIGITFLERK